MTDKPKKLSDTARALLSVTALRDDHLIALPKLPVAAARQVVRSLLNAGFAEEVPAPMNDAGYAWHTGRDGGVRALRATALGITRALGGDGDSEAGYSAGTTKVQAGDSTVIAVDPFTDAIPVIAPAEEGRADPDRQVNVPAPALSAEAPEATSKPARPAKRTNGLGSAAQALLDAWDNTGGHGRLGEITGPIIALRAALAPSVGRSISSGATSLGPDTKQSKVLAMLARDEGASGPQIAEAMGWAPHTVRGFLASLARKGIRVEVLERVRQVGPNKVGTKGSFTVYRVGDGRS
jgi:hypothetical protein